MTMCGPCMLRDSERYASREMVCSVLPVGWLVGVCVCERFWLCFRMVHAYIHQSHYLICIHNQHEKGRKEIERAHGPSPISSARMPLMPLSWSLIIQLSPSSWYGRIVPASFMECVW